MNKLNQGLAIIVGGVIGLGLYGLTVILTDIDFNWFGLIGEWFF